MLCLPVCPQDNSKLSPNFDEILFRGMGCVSNNERIDVCGYPNHDADL